VSFVLDNSVALAWCFADEQTPAVMDLLDRVAETDATAPPDDLSRNPGRIAA
jgi:hypothetical protein